jgi:uncharacterized membrane protein YcgQ (UPF0703/DUF1980 family)
MQIPVYVFTGFLESGKTKFIQETLEDKRFNSGERTLLLVCEEGEEQYNPSSFSAPYVYMKTVEDPSELTKENLSVWLKENKCRRVIVEYNGMWLLPALFQNMPENWVIYQEFMFADANTFLMFNTNMRSLVVDKLNTCELVVFNRYSEKVDKMALHKIVRGTSRRSDIAYESADGQVEYDDIEDPLPFDVNADHIKIEDQDYALWYRDMGENLEIYNGKTVTFKGVIVLEKELGKDAFIIGRQVMTCCVDDITFAGLVANYKDAIKLTPRSWVKITAKIQLQTHPLYGRRGPVLDIISLQSATAPENEVATFF